MEVLRDAVGIPCGGEHMPSYQVRLLAADSKSTEVMMRRIGHDWRWKIEERDYFFRRFVQIRGGAKRYYKQFGDPREFSYIDGKEITSRDAETSATELIYCPNYVPGTEYGMPDWSGQALNIGGSFRMERGNFRYFANNMIPALFLLVMGGKKIGEKGFKKIMAAFDEAKGDDSQSRLVGVQLPSDASDTSTNGKIDVPKVLLQAMTQYQRNDATHQNYDERNMKKIMSTKRLPPLIIGLSSDYNRATSDAAMLMWERQVCGPERNQFDDQQNRLIVNAMGVRFHEFRSNEPDLSDPEIIARVSDAIGRHGGISINSAIDQGNKLLGTNVPPYPGEDGNLPLDIVLEKMKSRAQDGGLQLSDENVERTSAAITDFLTKILLYIHDNVKNEHGA
jgi:capsid portal protein